MKRKIVTILLTLSMVLGSVLTPLEIKAKTEVSDRQSVEWNGNTCGYQVVLPEGYDPDGGWIGGISGRNGGHAGGNYVR